MKRNSKQTKGWGFKFMAILSSIMMVINTVTPVVPVFAETPNEVIPAEDTTPEEEVTPAGDPAEDTVPADNDADKPAEVAPVEKPAEEPATVGTTKTDEDADKPADSQVITEGTDGNQGSDVKEDTPSGDTEKENNNTDQSLQNGENSETVDMPVKDEIGVKGLGKGVLKGNSLTTQNVSEADVAKIGDTGYETLQGAIDDAQEEATITLLSNINIEAQPVTITKDLTINLNGHNITATDVRALWIKNGDVTITGSGTISANGSNLNPDSSVIRVGDSVANAKKAKLTIEEDVLVTSNKSYGITVFGLNNDGREGIDIEVVINGEVNVKGENSAISGNGTSTWEETTITIGKKGKIHADNDYAIYHPDRGTLIVNGNVEGKGGIEAKSGIVNIKEGATVEATADEQSNGTNGDGPSTVGYAIASVSHNGYVDFPTVNINGGNIIGKITTYADNSTKEAKIYIYGGTFSETVPTEFQTANATIVVADAEAKIGTIEYKTLSDAITGASAGQTIILMKNINLDRYVEVHGINIDLNGYTVSGDGIFDCYGDVKITDSSDGNTGKIIGRWGVWANNDAEITINGIRIEVKRANTETNYQSYGVIGSCESIDIKDTVITSESYGLNIGGSTEVTVTDSTINATYDNDTNCWGAAIFGNAILKINGETTITSKGYGISTNGNAGQNATIEINGGRIEGEELGIYQPSGTVTINGGNIIGATAIYQKAGTLTITGNPIITANGQAKPYEFYGNGGKFTADAVVVDNCDYPNGISGVNIEGGTFESTNGKAVASYVKQDDPTQSGTSERVTGFVKGGTFSTNPAAYVIAGKYINEVDGKFEVTSENTGNPVISADNTTTNYGTNGAEIDNGDSTTTNLNTVILAIEENNGDGTEAEAIQTNSGVISGATPLGEVILDYYKDGKKLDTVKFTKPIKVNIPVTGGAEVKFVQILISHNGGAFGREGLTTDGTVDCTNGLAPENKRYDGGLVPVVDGYATIYTCQASTVVTAANQYYSTLDANGGKGGIPVIFFKAGTEKYYANSSETIDVTDGIVVPTKNGYSFLGYFDITETKVIDEDGKIISGVELYKNLKNVPLHAEWLNNENTFTCQVKQGETTSDCPAGTTANNSISFGTTITLKNPTINEGYQFKGWTFTDGTNPIAISDLVENPAGTRTFTMPNSDVVATAKIVACNVKIGEVCYETLSGAVAAAQNGDTVTMVNDEDITDQVVIDKDLTLDLNGKTIYNSANIWDKTPGQWSLISVQGGEVILTGNGKLDAKENDSYALDVRDGGKLTIENGTFIGNVTTVYVYEGDLVVNGGTYKLKQLMSGVTPEDQHRFTLNCLDANYTNKTAKIEVNGGTFEHFNPADNKAESGNGGTEFTTDDYTAVQDGDNYVVVDAVTVSFVQTMTGIDKPAAQKIKKGTKVTAPAEPSKDGYSFLGWFATGAESAFDFNTEVDTGIVLTSRWDAKGDTDYTVEKYLQKNDGTWDATTTNIIGRTGTTATIVSVADEDKTAEGYIFDENNINNVLTGEVAGDGSLKLKLYFKKTFTVTWLNEDLTELYSGTNPYGTNPVYGGPTPKKGDPAYEYELLGWYKQSDPNKTVVNLTEETVTSDVTYVAKYGNPTGDRTYTVTWNYKAADATATGTTTEVDYNTNPTAPSIAENPQSVSTGYSFAGWKDSTTTYAVDAQLPEVEGDITYEATYTETPRIYTITWNYKDAGGNDVTTGTEVAYGDNPTHANPETYLKNGWTYEFTGWKDANDTLYAVGVELPTVGGEVAYTAVYAKSLKQYTLTYIFGNGTDNRTGSFRKNDSITASYPVDPVKEGYTFTGWTWSGQTTPTMTLPTKMPASDLTITAEWDAKKYQVTLNLNYEGAPAAEDITVTYDALYTGLTTPEREGYTFTGWFTDATNGDRVNTGDTVKITANTTLYAHWIANTYVVTFDAGSGTVTPTTGSVTFGEKYTTLPTQNPELTGYTFLGWFTDSTNGTPVTIATDVTTASNHTIYAHWSENHYTIKFDANNGEGTMSDMENIAYTELTGLIANEFTRNGYTFTGWATTVDGDKVYGDEEVVSKLVSGNGATVTLYAKWIKDSYTITYNLNDGTVSTANPENYDVDSSSITLNNPTREGYTFAGWTGTALTVETISVTIPAGSTGNREYTANWTAIEYPILYTLNGGTVSGNPTSYTIESGDITLNNPTRDGYIFSGWSGTDLLALSTTVTIVSGSTGQRTYEAVWTASGYTITYALDGGTVSTENPITYTVESSAITLNNPTKEGYTFTGWTGTDLIEKTMTVIITNGSTGDRNYTANWEANKYTVTYDPNGGSVTPTSGTVIYGDNYPELPIPARDGYSFNGWFTEVSSGTQVTSGTTVTATGAHTIYAQWTQNPATNTSSSSSSGGGGGGGGGSSRNNTNNMQEVVLGGEVEVNTGDEAEISTGDENKLEENNDNDEGKGSIGDTQGYDPELVEAYKWAYANGITTMPTIEEARLKDGITRAELAKMMVVFMSEVLHRQPVITETFDYPDVNEKALGDLTGYIQLAYQYQIMGIQADGKPLNKFNPRGKVSRAEFATVLSRVLYESVNNQKGANYREKHIEALNKAGILTNTDPKIQELRGWIILMLYRSQNDGAENVENNGDTNPEANTGDTVELTGDVVETQTGTIAETTTGDVAELTGEVAELTGDTAELTGSTVELTGSTQEIEEKDDKESESLTGTEAAKPSETPSTGDAKAE